MNGRSWVPPLTGLAFLVLVIVGFAIGGEPPDVDDNSAEEIVEWYVDNDGSIMFGAALQTLAATLLIFFGAYLWRLLREADQRGGAAALATFAGMVVLGVGIAIDGTINFAAADNAEDIDPTAVQALATLWQGDFLPLALGTQVFLLGLGVSVIRWGALPTWIGWIAVVLGVIAVTPIGWVSFLAGGILIGVISVMLALRERSASGGPPPAPTSPPGAPPQGT
ncbi:MAG: DUF4386 family protein [Solirubrobacterales bacterium]